ncbi:MAG: hypothetical protein A2W90_13180 [Bacteroidetes bacterium GWF2_42_66]|nr:MAG: hypothetical protein A2W92_19310 [Bacteroidetes bacterium GWA2_42_15]OFY00170.1 MAG: hypothetical protein A2W89_18170 [Bacteroidetes bacterium GWE2_42_39]OFY40312.1 MAG: hypothetical protein A2W90_13180 [Bacteroidetes bacterium GWF2_42_66]HBL73703.1 hypothetical protein [Prolixibacteraceae bacterium]HCR90713.1 hypothetical protein [Prolixibacteraceae bacterium]
MNFSIGKIFKGDKVLWIVLIFLSLISLLIVYSATGKLAYKVAGGNTGYYLFRQLVFIGLGIGLMIFLVNVVPVKIYSIFANLMVGVTFVALIAAFVQYKIDGSKETSRTLTFWMISFQPSELAKISLVMYASKMLSKYQKTKEELRHAFFWVTGVSAVICGIIFIGNISTSALIFGSIMCMLFVARVPLKYFFMLLAIIISLAVTIYFAADFLPESFGRVHTFKERIDDFIYGDDNSKEGTTQADFAKLAIYEGGLMGKGPGNSEVSNYMEAGYNDFIYSIIIEEYGFVGGIFVLFLYLIFFYRGVVIVRKSDRTFPAFLVTGLVLVLVFQAFINMAVSSGVVPVTGQPLPWISLGGTSMLFTAVAFGAILTVSYHNNKQKEAEEQLVTIDTPDEDQAL